MTTPTRNNIETERDETRRDGWRLQLTSYEHDDDGKTLFTIRIWTRETEVMDRQSDIALSHLTLPKPTDVKEEKVKYNAVIYLEVFVGPDVGSESL